MNFNFVNLSAFRLVSRFPRAVILFALLLPLSAQAQENSDSWQFRMTAYGWFTAVGASTSFPTGGGGDIEVDFEDIVDNLEFAFMGAFLARKGKWGIFSDVTYVNLGGQQTKYRQFTIGGEPIPAGVEMSASMDMKSWLVTLGGVYSLAQSDRGTLDLFFGTRMVDMKQKLDWELTGDIGDIDIPGPSGQGKVSATVWDAVIGLKGYTFLGDSDRWFVPYHFDIGTGDSDLTWQAMAGVGYQFNWGAMVLNYRYLDYDIGSLPITDLNMGGPMLGASFAW